MCLTVFYLYFINKSKQNAWQASLNPFIWYPKFRSPKISISHPLPHSLHIWSHLMRYTLSSPIGSHRCSRHLHLGTPLLQTRYWQQNSTKRRVAPRYTLWFQGQQPRSLDQDNLSAMFWKFLISCYNYVHNDTWRHKTYAMHYHYYHNIFSQDNLRTSCEHIWGMVRQKFLQKR